jgi:TolB protein
VEYDTGIFAVRCAESYSFFVWTPKLDKRMRLSFKFRVLPVLALLGTKIFAQIPTAYPIATPHPDKQLQAAGQMYLESMYLPSVTRGPWSPTWSPDGREIAISMHGSIWTIPANGGDAVQLTASPQYDSQPSWSPDGSRIAFVRDDGHSMHLWVVDAKSSVAQQITQGQSLDVDPEWHSSSRIYYSSTPGGAPFGLWQVAAEDGKPEPVLADGKQTIEPASSPKGEKIVFVSTRHMADGSSGSYGSGDLWTMDLNTKVLRLLLKQETLWEARPRWSPDGKTIVFVSQQTGKNQIFLLDADTGIPVQLTYVPEEVFAPSWSPDGKQVAFVSSGDHEFKLCVMPAAGGEPKSIDIASLRWQRPVGKVTVAIQDERGEKTAARVYLTSSDGKAWAPNNAFERLSVITGDHYFQTNGDFTVEVPAGDIMLEIMKGFQYRPERKSVRIAANQTANVTIKLERLTNLQAEGWYSGDNHLHMNYGGVYAETPASLISEAAAEDLDVTNSFPTNQNTRLLDLQYFTGKPDPTSTSDHILYFNEEYRPNFAGHMGLLNMKQFYFPVYDGYTGTPFGADYPTNADVLDAMHAQGAIGGYVHPYLINPGGDPLSDKNFIGAREFPADVSLGKTDYYDLMCVWTDPGVAASVVYRLWNLGFKVPLSAGSDAMPSYWRAPTIGGVRVYVHATRPLDYQHWIEALVRGRSFVTNGPILRFTVDGHEPGEELHLDGSSQVAVDAEVTSAFPVERLEIVQNGNVIASQKSEDGFHIHLKRSFPVSASGWIAARVFGPQKVHFITDSYVYAHSNPIFLTARGEKPYSKADADYFVRWQDEALEVIPTREFRNEEQKSQTMDLYRRARAKFLELGSESKAAR